MKLISIFAPNTSLDSLPKILYKIVINHPKIKSKNDDTKTGKIVWECHSPFLVHESYRNPQTGISFLVEG